MLDPVRSAVVTYRIIACNKQTNLVNSLFAHHPYTKHENMMKIAAFVALLAGSASAFAPSATNGRVSTAVAAEKSAALPFMNRPALVS